MITPDSFQVTVTSQHINSGGMYVDHQKCALAMAIKEYINCDNVSVEPWNAFIDDVKYDIYPYFMFSDYEIIKYQNISITIQLTKSKVQ